MLYVIALLPIIICVLVVKAMDGFSIASWRRLASGFVWGALCCAALFFLSRTARYESAAVSSFLEEFLKCFPLILAIFRKRVAFFAEALIYGTAVGAGFAFLENIAYVALLPEFSLGDSILRGFGTAVLHMGCTALYASLAVTVSRALAGRKAVLSAAAGYACIIPSFAIHFTYNLFLIQEFLQLACVILLMSALLFIIYDIDEKLIHKWLDSCISNDISLLASIKEGHLKDTSAGKYLLEIRRRFQPEAFFDICVYLGLYLEMSIAAKSRMIMKEAGIDLPADPDTLRSNLAKLEELKSLRKNIGVAGLLVLSPIIDMKAVDEWVLFQNPDNSAA